MISKAELRYQLKLATNKPFIVYKKKCTSFFVFFFLFITKRNFQQYFYIQNFSKNKVFSKKIVCVKNSYFNIKSRSNDNKNKAYNSCLDFFEILRNAIFFYFTFWRTKKVFMYSSRLCITNLMYNWGILSNYWIILN